MSERSERVAEALWRHDGYDLNADPTSRTAQEWRPEYMARASAVLDALGDDPAQAKVERVEALADWYDANPNWREWGVGATIRAALDPETGQ